MTKKWAILLICGLIPVAGCSTYPKDVRATLKTAGDNRSELKKVLAHYETTAQPQKYAAAVFLLSNMADQGFAEISFYDPNDNEVPFDSTVYANYDQASAAFRDLEDAHGELSDKKKEFTPDAKIITADFLIENIDLAFESWHQKPWAKDMSFDTFCETVLPYRGSNEPLDRWRKPLMARFADLPAKLDDPTDSQAAAKHIQKAVDAWIGFNDKYYLHPTDQSYSEMCRTKMGRCEDITNMTTFAMRANAVATAADYTPAWANRDNNHAWTAILDKNGRGNAPLFNIPAKIYRKTFAVQPDAIVLHKNKHESIPNWLAGKHYIDVTDQYVPTTNVLLTCTEPAPENVTYAYLCVFNGGDWAPIAAGKLDGPTVTFERMGRDIVYLPVYDVKGKNIPAAAAFTLNPEGRIQILDAPITGTESVVVTTTKPEITDDDTRLRIPTASVEPGKTYELLVWDDEWKSLGEQTAGVAPIQFDNLADGRLYWLTDTDGEKLERVFTLQDGQQTWW